MSSSSSRVATTIVLVLVVTACSVAPSLAPTATQSPSGSTAASTPDPTPTPPAPANAAIAAGYTHTCVLTGSGGVRCWGSNHNGELGNGSTSEAAVPSAVDVVGLSSGVIAIAAGGMHTCALTSGGGVKCWGSNTYGQLGNGTTVNDNSSIAVDVVGLSSGVTAISVGWSHTCALTSAGGVKCWGDNHHGWLGDGTTTNRSVPVDVVGLGRGVSAIAAGTLHTCALKNGGGVTCWGYGQSDDPTIFTTSVPTDVAGLRNGVLAIAAGLDRTCALTNEGGVTCWGPNYSPPLGESLPPRITRLDLSSLSSRVAAIALGETNLCALTSGGGVACWGTSNVPVDVPGLTSDITAIATGGLHACAVTSAGEVRCWGSNVSGQLGNVMRCSSTSVPIDVPTEPGATPRPTAEPPSIPIGRIDHATGARDVVLRFDRGPDFAVGDLVGELFQPGPEFTLYGDGTVIFRNEGTEPAPADGPMIRGRPFMIGQLDEEQVQSFLRFALAEGGLWDACERYETQGDVDRATFDVFTIRAGGLNKRVDNGGDGPFAALYDRLRNFESAAGIPRQVWVTDRFTGNLLDASIFANIGEGLVPGLAETGSVAWPWPGIAPADFVGLAEFQSGRRVMSAAEAAVLGLSDKGGVVQRIYLRGPDQRLYYFSLWPMSPDETS